MYCTNCGAKLDEDSKVCNNCKEVVNNKPRKKFKGNNNISDCNNTYFMCSFGWI